MFIPYFGKKVKVMKNIIWLFVVWTLFGISCRQQQQKEQAGGEQPAAAQSDLVYLVGDLLQNPEEKVDQLVRVQGTVTHVCRHSGKRLHLVALDGGEMIRVEAGEKIVRFERELEGSDIVARGILRKEVINHQTIRDMEGRGGGSHDGEGDDASHDQEAQDRAKNLRKMLDNRGVQEVTIYWLDGEGFEEI